jgi:hypothetical protein
MAGTTKQSHEESEDIILHFGTKPHELDAKTLLESFGGIESALVSIARYGHPDAVLRIKVRAFQAGSFEVPIQVQQWVGTATAALKLNWQGVKESVTILTEVIKLKSLFKDKVKDKEPPCVKHIGNNVEIKDSEGCTNYFDQRSYHLHLHDAVVDEAITKTFKAMESDKEVKEFTVLDEKRKKLLDVPRRSFRELGQSNQNKETDEQKTYERLNLPIFKVVFDKGYKWKFYYRGITKISATIADEKFIQSVKHGDVDFGSGDTLDVDLEITKGFDKKLNALVHKSYKILKVHGVQRRPKQEPL